MKVAGIDYSMTSPAICVWDDETPFELANFKLYSYNSGAKKCNGVWTLPGGGVVTVVEQAPWVCAQQRYDNVSTWAIGILTANGVEKAAMEGYSMGSSSGMVFNIGENGGLLKHKMWKAGIAFDCPSPGSVKKSFTGKGNAKKDAVCDVFQEKFGIRLCDLWGTAPYGAPENDLVDSVAIVGTFRKQT